MVKSNRIVMVRAAVLAAAVSGALSLSGERVTAQQPAMAGQPTWPGDDFPLPLVVKTSQDLSFKTEAERQYLMFNLMTSGKLAFDTGDFPRAATRWETLLKLPNVPPEIERVVKPLLAVAQKTPRSLTAPPPPVVNYAPPVVMAPPLPPMSANATPEETVELQRAAAARVEAPRPDRVSVSGTVTGGGPIGPGGTVLFLHRTDGPTPSVRGGRTRIVNQKDKVFIPRVLAVPVGTKVEFRNDDPFYHNVFSLSESQRFDTGLYASGLSYSQTFNKPGPVELLCNIHASMVGYVYVVDTPYYTQPRGNGAFVIRNVPPGRYELSAWHESSASVIKQSVNVSSAGATGISVKIPSDRPPLVVVPDKYGKPRQPQLGY